MLSFCLSTGFCRKKVAPMENTCCMVSLSSRPVTMIIGVDLFQDDLRIRRARSKPLKLGISRSSKIPSNFS